MRTLHQSLHVTPVPHAHGIEPMTAGHLERPAASCQSETTDSMLAGIGGHWCCWTIFRNPTHPTDEERLVISNKNKVLPEKGGGGGARAAVAQQLELVVERREDPPSPASDRVSALDHTHLEEERPPPVPLCLRLCPSLPSSREAPAFTWYPSLLWQNSVGRKTRVDSGPRRIGTTTPALSLKLCEGEAVFFLEIHICCLHFTQLKKIPTILTVR